MKGQTDGFRDWYRIMQVHYLAEPEVIEGAYKRLSKKYHPDTNKEAGAEAKMKLINQAYCILSDSKQREAYDQLYLQRLAEKEKSREREARPKPAPPTLAEQAAKVIAWYFRYLSRGEFANAYDLISYEDQKYIGKADFLEWQGLVSGLYEIGEYQYIHFKTYSGKETGNKNFLKSFEFQVSVAEREKNSGKVNQVKFFRLVVLEKNRLKMYLGYQDIRSIITKFKYLSKEQAVVEEIGVDRQWLVKEIEREVARAARYNRPLTLLLLEAASCQSLRDDQASPEYLEAVMGTVLQTILRCLRKTDYCGRWSPRRIMIVLTETRLYAATKVAGKIMGLLKAWGESPDGGELPVFCAGIVQYKQTSTEELLELLYANTIAAKNRGEWQIVF